MTLAPTNRPYAQPSDPMLQFFSYSHLRSDLQLISIPFANLAQTLVSSLPPSPERTVALRKLLEAKDCAVRAKLYISDWEVVPAPHPDTPSYT